MPEPTEEEKQQQVIEKYEEWLDCLGDLNNLYFNFEEYINIFEEVLQQGNDYSNNYFLYCVLDKYSEVYVNRFSTREEAREFLTWVNKLQDQHDLQLLSIENAWNDYIRFLEHIKPFQYYGEDLPIIKTPPGFTIFRDYNPDRALDLEDGLKVFLPAAGKLIETSPPQYRHERQRLLQTLKGFAKDLKSRVGEERTRVDYRDFYSRWPDLMAEFYKGHTPNPKLIPDFGVINEIEWAPPLEGCIDAIIAFQSRRFSFDYPPEEWEGLDEGEYFGSEIALIAPVQGWKKVEQLVREGVEGIELEKALSQVVPDIRLRNDKLEKAYKAQNLWFDPQIQIGGLVSSAQSLIVSPLSGFTININGGSFWVFKSKLYDPAQQFKRIEDFHPFNVSHPGMIVLNPGIQFNNQDIKQRGAYDIHQPGSIVVPPLPEKLYSPNQHPIGVMQPDYPNSISSPPPEFIPVIPGEQVHYGIRYNGAILNSNHQLYAWSPNVDFQGNLFHTTNFMQQAKVVQVQFPFNSSQFSLQQETTLPFQQIRSVSVRSSLPSMETFSRQMETPTIPRTFYRGQMGLRVRISPSRLGIVEGGQFGPRALPGLESCSRRGTWSLGPGSRGPRGGCGTINLMDFVK